MEKREIKLKINHAKRWADRLMDISNRFDNGEVSLAEYMVEIRAVKEIGNLAYVEAVYGERSFLKEDINTKVIEIKENK